MTTRITMRRYKLGDIQACIDIVQQYTSGATYVDGHDRFKGLEFDADAVSKALHDNVNNPDFFCNVLLADEEVVGGLCAYIAVPMFSKQRIAYDQLLYTVPDFNKLKAVIRLIQAYAEWAKHRNAQLCYLRTATLYREQAFTMLCKRLGFKHTETVFAKEM